MKNLSEALNRNPFYFTGYLIFLGILSFYCCLLPKGEGFLLINHFHNDPLNYFFILFTHVGNGLFVIGLMLFFLLRRKFGWTLQVGVSFILSGLIVQVLKHLISSPRPKLFFPSDTIYCIHGITGTGNSSFPSGHTATIFALLTLLSIYIPGRKPGLLFIGIAVLTGFSRIYLAQHFPIDVLAGSLIGLLVSLIIYQVIPLRIFEKRFQDTNWDNQTIKLR